MIDKFRFGQDSLKPDILLKLVREELKGVLTDQIVLKINKCFEAVQAISRGEKLVYSINTGFGSLCTTKISKEETRKLQENLLKSHSAGLGNPVDQEIAKLMLIIKVHTLSKGYSGCSLELIKRIIWHIENNYIPLVPEQGSVGASGDLAPLAHLFL
ncbi:MAG: aromatic amino acid lyase, partial [Promethearchaeota archaeon]